MIAKKLKDDIQLILSSLSDVGEIAANTPLKERVLLSYQNKIKEELGEILAPSSLDSLTLYNDLLKFFKKNLQRTQGSLLSYTALPAAKVTQCLYTLACLAAAYYNDHLKTEEELPTFGAALLFPDVDLDSYSQTRSISLSIIHPIPFWNSNKKRELSFLSCLIYFSNYPKEEEQMVFSAEEEREVAEIDVLHFQLRQAKDKDLTQKKEQLRLKTGQLSRALQEKIKHRNNLRRQKVLQLNKEAFQNYQFWKEQGKLQERAGCLVPTLLPQDLLPRYILSEDKRYLLPISLLLDETSFQGLTLSEQQRLMKHSPETEAYGNALERLKWIESDQSHLLGQLTFLCRQLRAYDAHEGVGTAENAGSGAYQPIINFFAWYKLLRKEETAKIPAPLKEQIELLGRLSSDPKLNKNATEQIETCIGTRREALQKAMKGLDEKLIKIACQGPSRERALKAAQDEVMKAKIALVQKLEQPDYQGQDAWPLTKKILEAFSVKLTINTLADLNDFMGLEAEEIKEIGAQAEGNQALANILTSIEELVIFIHEQPLRKLEAFLDICKPHLWLRLCKSAGDARAILSSLEGDKLVSIFQSIYLETSIKRSELFNLFIDEPDQLVLLLKSLSEDQRLDFLQEKGVLGKTVLHYAVSNSELLTKLLSLYSLEQGLEAAKGKGNFGCTVLHEAVRNPESLKIILALYPEEQRLNAVKAKGNLGRTLLHDAANNPESLKIILALYPEEQQFAAVKEKDKHDCSLLHLAANNPESLKIILALYPEDLRLEAIKERDKYDSFVLHYAVFKPESLRVLLESLPEKQRIELLKERDENGRTLLHSSIHYLELSKVILESLSLSKQGLAAVKEKDRHGLTVLHHACLKSCEALKVILNSLPKEQRLEALKEKDFLGETVFHLAVGKPKSLNIILESLPEEQRFEALKIKNAWGATVLCGALKNPESLKIIFKSLPEEQRLKTLKEKNKAGNMMLHLASSNPELLKIIMENLPETQRAEAIQIAKTEKAKAALSYYAIELQKNKRKYANEGIQSKIDNILNASLALKMEPAVAQVLQNTYALLGGTMLAEGYQEHAKAILCDPKQSMQILGRAMMALGAAATARTASTVAGRGFFKGHNHNIGLSAVVKKSSKWTESKEIVENDMAFKSLAGSVGTKIG